LKKVKMFALMMFMLHLMLQRYMVGNCSVI
jgi:hypothetical protein